MNLILLHPRLLDADLSRCQTWLYDERHQIVRRLGEKVRRPPDTLLPCWKCPKQSPAAAAGCERDMERIARTVRLYFEVQATAGRCLSEREAADRLLARHLAIVDGAAARPWPFCRVASRCALKRNDCRLKGAFTDGRRNLLCASATRCWLPSGGNGRSPTPDAANQQMLVTTLRLAGHTVNLLPNEPAESGDDDPLVENNPADGIAGPGETIFRDPTFETAIPWSTTAWTG